MFQHVTSLLDEQRPRYFLWAPVFLGAGAGIYFVLPHEPLLPPLTVVPIIAAATVVALRSQITIIRTTILAFCLITIGLSLASHRAKSLSSAVLQETFIGTVQGRVIHLDRSASNRLRITLDHLVLYGLEPSDTPARVRITLPSADATATVGRAIMIFAKLDGPGAPVEPGGFDFRRWAWFKQLGGVGYALGPVMAGVVPPEKTLTGEVAQIRHVLANLIRSHVPGTNGGFAAAILAGERSAIDPATLEDLRASNLAHLLAISGLHMGLLTGFVFGLFRYGLAAIPPLALRYNAKKIGALAAIPAGLAYLIISGASVATQRAFVMALVVLVAVLLDRPAFTLRAVAVAALIVLVIAPESITSVGFQLSFAATIGLVAGFELLRQLPLWQRPAPGWRKFAKGTFSVAFSSAVAGFATAPFAAFHFNQFPQYGLIANLMAVPIMGFVVMPALLTALILTPFGLGIPFYLLAGAGIGAILQVASFVAGFEGAVVRVPSAHAVVLPLMATGALVAILWIGHLRWLGVSLVALSLGLWIMHKRPDILIDETGQLIGVMTHEGRALNKTRGQGFSANAWLEHDGDSAHQKTAGAREWSDETVIVLGKKARPSESDCARSGVVVAPHYEGEVRLSCLLITKEILKKSGAVAVYLREEGVEIKKSRGPKGARLWTQ